MIPLPPAGPLPFVLLLALASLCSARAFAQDEIRAGRSRTHLGEGAATRVYADSVAATFGRVAVWSDSARLRTGDARTTFLSRVLLRDGERQVRADLLVYDADRETADFRGGVVLSDGERTLTADRVTYEVAGQTARAQGQAAVDFPSQGVGLRAPRLTYHASSDSGLAVGGARLSAAGTDTLFVEADSLFFGPAGRTARLRGGVRAWQGQVEATAREGAYACTVEKRATLDLWGGPALSFASGDSASPESSEATADTVRLWSVDGRLERSELTGEAVLLFRRSAGGRQDSTRVTSRESVVRFEGGEVSGVTATGDSRLVMVSRARERVEGSGDRTDLSVQGGQPDSVALFGSAGLTFTQAEGNGQSHLSGRRIVVRFLKEVVREVTVDSQAVCDHVPADPDSASTHLSADRVRLTFDDGKLTGAIAEGGARGRLSPGGAP